MTEEAAVLEEIPPPGAEPEASVVEASPEADDSLLVALWVSEAAKQRLLDSHAFEITDDRSRLSESDVVVVSTRLPRGTPVSYVEQIREATTSPVVVLCHPGGEERALQMMRIGANAVVAEGRERALARLLVDLPGDESLVDSYAGAADRQWAAGTTHLRRDPVTGIPGSAAYELRLAELEVEAIVPLLTLLEVSDLEETERVTGPAGLDVLRRRLSSAFANLAGIYHGEIFSLTPERFAVIGRDQTPQDGRVLAEMMINAATGFAPGASALRLAVGQAGPEVASEVSALRNLAEKALLTAIGREGSTIVDAEDLTRSLAGQTELDATLRIVGFIDEASNERGSHSQRVADYAAELAQELAQEFDLDNRSRDRITLAGRLHEVGKISQLDQEDVDDRDHVERGYEYALVSAGSEVAAAVRHHHESWDGTGFPDGLAAEEIPVGARIVAIADNLDHWMSGVNGSDPLSLEGAIERLEEQSGSRFDPSVVSAAIRLLRQ